MKIDHLAETIELNMPLHMPLQGASDPFHRCEPERGVASIEVIERTSSNSAIVCWSDARFGRLGAQTWMAGRARAPGRCALSGALIKRGDAVYQPRKTRPAAINAGTMIVATCVHDAPFSSHLARE